PATSPPAGALSSASAWRSRPPARTARTSRPRSPSRRPRGRGRPFYPPPPRQNKNQKRAERLQAALCRISDAGAAIEDMEGLYVAIHRIVGEFMYARNFYIAVRNENEGTVSFPYFVDEADAAPPVVK